MGHRLRVKGGEGRGAPTLTPFHPQPMDHSTPEPTHPSEQSLQFLRLFARLYNPNTCHEHDARLLACMAACPTQADC